MEMVWFGMGEETAQLTRARNGGRPERRDERKKLTSGKFWLRECGGRRRAGALFHGGVGFPWFRSQWFSGKFESWPLVLCSTARAIRFEMCCVLWNVQCPSSS